MKPLFSRLMSYLGSSELAEADQYPEVAYILRRD